MIVALSARDVTGSCVGMILKINPGERLPQIGEPIAHHGKPVRVIEVIFNPETRICQVFTDKASSQDLLPWLTFHVHNGA